MYIYLYPLSSMHPIQATCCCLLRCRQNLLLYSFLNPQRKRHLLIESDVFSAWGSIKWQNAETSRVELAGIFWTNRIRMYCDGNYYCRLLIKRDSYSQSSQRGQVPSTSLLYCHNKCADEIRQVAVNNVVSTINEIAAQWGCYTWMLLGVGTRSTYSRPKKIKSQ